MGGKKLSIGEIDWRLGNVQNLNERYQAFVDFYAGALASLRSEPTGLLRSAVSEHAFAIFLQGFCCGRREDPPMRVGAIRHRRREHPVYFGSLLNVSDMVTIVVDKHPAHYIVAHHSALDLDEYDDFGRKLACVCFCAVRLENVAPSS